MARAGNSALSLNPQVPADSMVVNKFGRNPDIDTTTDPEDVWVTGGLYPFQSSDIALEIVSLSADDDKDAGTGAQSVTIQGLDAAGLMQTETVQLEGLTPVAIPGTWLRVFRASCVAAGSGGVNAGNIIIRASGGGTTYATINAGDGQTTMAIYTVPSNKKGKIFRHWASFDKQVTATAVMHLMVRMQGESWQVKQAFTINNNSAWDFLYYGGGIDVHGLTDIRMEVVEVSGNDVAIDAGFDLWMVDA